MTKTLMLSPKNQLAFVDLAVGTMQDYQNSGWVFPSDELLVKINEILPSLLK